MLAASTAAELLLRIIPELPWPLTILPSRSKMETEKTYTPALMMSLTYVSCRTAAQRTSQQRRGRMRGELREPGARGRARGARCSAAARG